MSKRKLTADEAIQDILRFVENDRNEDEFVDDLDEVYDDDDIHAAIDSDDGESSSSDTDGNENERPPRKMLTAKRLVNSIDKSLDETCYDKHNFGMVENDDEAVILTGYLGPKKNPKTEKVFWTNSMPSNSGRQRSCDILPSAPVPATLLPLAAGIESVSDAFHVLFPVDMVELIVKHTNSRIQHVQDNLPEYYARTNKNTYIRPLTHREFYAFIGLLYARGLLGQSMHASKILFSETAGHAIFSGTMSKHRFSFLLSVLSFDDSEERRELWKSDRFAAARELTNLFNDRMKNVLVPSEYLSIDETLYAMRHQIGFRQYNPNKPAKYGLLYKSLNDARFPFTYQIIPYSGKPVDGDGPYYLKATEDYVKNLVESIPGRNLKGRNISMDRLYTSIPTANWLLSREITVVGTLQSNRLGLPDELKNPKDRDEFQSTIHWEKDKGNIALCAYTTKSKSKGNKNVLVLSTMRPLLGVTKDDGKCKPAVIKFYDFTKGGTDVMDMKMAKYSCKALTHRWTMVHFYFLLDAIRCNTLSLFAVKHGKSLRAVDSFESCWDLVMNLVTPFISERPLTGLSIGLKSKISTLLGRNHDQPVDAVDDGYPRYGPTRQRCQICLNSIAGKDHQKNRDKLKKIQTRCQKCGKAVCEAHSKLICQKDL